MNEPIDTVIVLQGKKSGAVILGLMKTALVVANVLAVSSYGVPAAGAGAFSFGGLKGAVSAKALDTFIKVGFNGGNDGFKGKGPGKINGPQGDGDGDGDGDHGDGDGDGDNGDGDGDHGDGDGDNGDGDGDHGDGDGDNGDGDGDHGDGDGDHGDGDGDHGDGDGDHGDGDGDCGDGDGDHGDGDGDHGDGDGDGHRCDDMGCQPPVEAPAAVYGFMIQTEAPTVSFADLGSSLNSSPVSQSVAVAAPLSLPQAKWSVSVKNVGFETGRLLPATT